MPESLIVDIDTRPGERVRFVSDLHLAHERCDALTKYRLAELFEGTDTLVVVGDMAETRPCPWRETGLQLRQDFINNCTAAGVRLVEIAGNHDPAVPTQLARFWGGRVVAMHGHAIFKEIAPWSWEYLDNKPFFREFIAAHPQADSSLEARLAMSRELCNAISPILKRKGPHIPLVSGFLHCFWPPERPWNIVMNWLRCPAAANRFADRFFPEAETLVFGHFHRKCFRRFPNRTVVNTGAWFRHARPYILDMQDAKITDFRPASPCPALPQHGK